MSETSVRLLRAAAEITGGEKALAERLGISQTLLGKFLDDRRELPDLLVLHAVDIILADRGYPGLDTQSVARPAQGSLHDQ